MNLKLRKRAYIKSIETIFDDFITDVDKQQKGTGKKIFVIKDDLEAKLKEIQRVRKLGEDLTTSESPYEIMSKYISVLRSIDEVSALEIKKVNENLVDISAPVFSCVIGDQQWKQTGHFDAFGEELSKIAATSDGKLAVCRSRSMYVCMYVEYILSDSKYQGTFQVGNLTSYFSWGL